MKRILTITFYILVIYHNAYSVNYANINHNYVSISYDTTNDKSLTDNNKPTPQSSFIPSGVTTEPMIKSTNANKAAEDLQLNLEKEQAVELQRAEQETKARQQQEQPLDEFNQRTLDESYNTGFAPSGGVPMEQGEYEYKNNESSQKIFSILIAIGSIIAGYILYRTYKTNEK